MLRNSVAKKHNRNHLFGDGFSVSAAESIAIVFSALGGYANFSETGFLEGG